MAGIGVARQAAWILPICVKCHFAWDSTPESPAHPLPYGCFLSPNTLTVVRTSRCGDWIFGRSRENGRMPTRLFTTPLKFSPGALFSRGAERTPAAELASPIESVCRAVAAMRPAGCALVGLAPPDRRDNQTRRTAGPDGLPGTLSPPGIPSPQPRSDSASGTRRQENYDHRLPSRHSHRGTASPPYELVK